MLVFYVYLMMVGFLESLSINFVIYAQKDYDADQILYDLENPPIIRE